MPLLGGAIFGQIFCFKNHSKNQANTTVANKTLPVLFYVPLRTTAGRMKRKPKFKGYRIKKFNVFEPMHAMRRSVHAQLPGDTVHIGIMGPGNMGSKSHV